MNRDTRAFFHEQDIADQRIASLTWTEARQMFRPPTWCGAGDEAIGDAAEIAGQLFGTGCNSLQAGMVTGQDYCSSCDLYRGSGAAP
jgi:hypothetical protein